MYFSVQDGKNVGFFALNMKCKTFHSLLIGDSGKQDFRDDCCCTDLRKFFSCCFRAGP